MLASLGKVGSVETSRRDKHMICGPCNWSARFHLTLLFCTMIEADFVGHTRGAEHDILILVVMVCRLLRGAVKLLFI